KQVKEKSTHFIVQYRSCTSKSLNKLGNALENALGSFESIVISTAELVLLCRIIHLAHPTILTSLEPIIPRAVYVTLPNCRSNSVCKHKLHGAAMAPEDNRLLDSSDVSGQPLTQLGEEVMRLRNWAEETATGDRDDLKPGVTGEAWRQVSVTAR